MPGLSTRFLGANPGGAPALLHLQARWLSGAAGGPSKLPPESPGKAPPAPSSDGSGGGALAWLRARKGELKDLFSRYGWFAGATYFGVYLATLGAVYGGVTFGVLPSPDVNAFLNGLSLKSMLLGPTPVEIAPKWQNFATAWVITKTTEPVRLVATIFLVPVLVKRLPASVLAVFGAVRR